MAQAMAHRWSRQQAAGDVADRMPLHQRPPLTRARQREAPLAPGSRRARLHRRLQAEGTPGTSVGLSDGPESSSADGSAQVPPPATTAAAATTTQPLEQLPTEKLQQQRVGEILSFCLPVVLVPLAEPIMSLIDTVALGRMADALQLAALGPSSLLLMFSNYILFWLSVGTLSLVAEWLKDRDAKAAATALSSSLFLAAVGGAAMGATYVLWGPQLLGLTGAGAAVLPFASSYVRIRALALPAVIVAQVAQAGLLAQRDSLSPFQVVLATSCVSLVGDVVLIGRLGMGVVGAALAHILAQYLGAALLLRALRRSRVVPTLRVPSAEELQALVHTFGALTISYVAKNLSYVMIQSTAAQLSTLLLAAHQPIWSLWCLVSFTNAPLESAALAFLPAAANRREQQETARLLMSLGAASGAVGSLVALGLPAVAPHLFTADPALWGHMRSVWLPGVLALLCCGVDVAATGVLIAAKDTAFVARAMGTCFLVLTAFLWWAHQALPGLPAVWWGLCVFFGMRAAQSLPRAVAKMGLLGGDSNGSWQAQLSAAPT